MIEYKVKVYRDGSKEWYLNDELHRDGAPAIEWNDGDKEWYLNGKLHREDGPAIEWADGTKYWFLNGKEVTEDEVMKKPKELTVAEISKLLGYDVKIVKE